MLDFAAFAYGLKAMYHPGKILSAVAEDNPAWALAQKHTDGGGSTYNFAIEYASPNRSAQFDKAQGNTGAVKGSVYQLTFGDDFGVVRILMKLLEGAKGNEKAIKDAAKSQANGILTALNNSLGRQMFGNGSGQLATIHLSADLATTTLLLADAEEVINFSVGQKIVFAADDASALRYTTALSITGIDEDAGSLTLSATPASLGGNVTVADAIFTEGDYDTASDRRLMVGLAGWNPVTVTDAFFGVTRTVHSTAHAGSRFNDASAYAGYSTEEAILLVASRIARGNGKCNICFGSFDRFRALVVALGSKEEFVKTVPVKDSLGRMVADVSFEAIRVHGPKGTIEFVPDRNCPSDRVYVGDINKLEVISIGEAPHWITDADSSQKLRTVDNAAAVEARLVAWPQMAVRRPSSWGHFIWT